MWDYLPPISPILNHTIPTQPPRYTIDEVFLICPTEIRALRGKEKCEFNIKLFFYFIFTLFILFFISLLPPFRSIPEFPLFPVPLKCYKRFSSRSQGNTCLSFVFKLSIQPRCNGGFVPIPQTSGALQSWQVRINPDILSLSPLSLLKFSGTSSPSGNVPNFYLTEEIEEIEISQNERSLS